MEITTKYSIGDVGLMIDNCGCVTECTVVGITIRGYYTNNCTVVRYEVVPKKINLIKDKHDSYVVLTLEEKDIFSNTEELTKYLGKKKANDVKEADEQHHSELEAIKSKHEKTIDDINNKHRENLDFIKQHNDRLINLKIELEKQVQMYEGFLKLVKDCVLRDMVKWEISQLYERAKNEGIILFEDSKETDNKEADSNIIN